MPADELCHCRIIHQDRVAKAQKASLGESRIEALSQLFKTIADPTRLKIILALEQGEMCVCDLAAYLKISESAVSHQLRTLKQMKMVHNRRDGSVLYYRFDNPKLSRLILAGLDNLEKPHD